MPTPLMESCEKLFNGFIFGPDIAKQDRRIADGPLALLGDQLVHSGVGVEVVARIIGFVHLGPPHSEYTSGSVWVIAIPYGRDSATGLGFAGSRSLARGGCRIANSSGHNIEQLLLHFVAGLKHLGTGLKLIPGGEHRHHFGAKVNRIRWLVRRSR